MLYLVGCGGILTFSLQWTSQQKLNKGPSIILVLPTFLGAPSDDTSSEVATSDCDENQNSTFVLYLAQDGAPEFSEASKNQTAAKLHLVWCHS